MQPFRVHRGRVMPLLRRDVDTDQIIPKQFLKRIDRTGFGEHLFHDWRHLPDGGRNPEFVLNDPRYAGASILLAGANFGCGSSREHAAWAILQHGFRAVIAPSFADIFRANAATNGLLPVCLADDVIETIAGRSADRPDYTLEIDLEQRRATDAVDLDAPFVIEEAVRHRLLNGLDDIDLILQHEAAITRFESEHTPPLVFTQSK
jgi:3-isopropylmalate/(R)-2-methylmalate dehydratase small subunit